jgi:hypothetical protein
MVRRNDSKEVWSHAVRGRSWMRKVYLRGGNRSAPPTPPPWSSTKGDLVLGNEQRIEIAIHRSSGPAPESLDQLDFGPLLGPLTEEPLRLAGIGEEGSLNLEITRTHEWELVIGLVVVGSTIFAEAVISEVANQIVKWTVEQAKKFTTRNPPRVRSPEGETAIVDAANRDASVEGIVKLFKEATERNLRVTLTLEPVE